MPYRFIAASAAALVVCGGVTFFMLSSGDEPAGESAAKVVPEPAESAAEKSPKLVVKPRSVPDRAVTPLKPRALTRVEDAWTKLELTDALIERFVDTAKALKKKGLELRPRARSGGYILTLSKGKFSPKSFGAVHSRVTYALRGIEYDDREEPPEEVLLAQEAQLETLGRFVSADAVGQMKRGVRNQRKPFFYDRISDEDKNIVRKHRAALEAVLGTPRQVQPVQPAVTRPTDASTYSGAPNEYDRSQYSAPGGVDYSTQTNYGSESRGGSETYGGGSKTYNSGSKTYNSGSKTYNSGSKSP